MQDPPLGTTRAMTFLEGRDMECVRYLCGLPFNVRKCWQGQLFGVFKHEKQEKLVFLAFHA